MKKSEYEKLNYFEKLYLWFKIDTKGTFLLLIIFSCLVAYGFSYLCNSSKWGSYEYFRIENGKKRPSSKEEFSNVRQRWNGCKIDCFYTKQEQLDYDGISYNISEIENACKRDCKHIHDLVNRTVIITDTTLIIGFILGFLVMSIWITSSIPPD